MAWVWNEQTTQLTLDGLLTLSIALVATNAPDSVNIAIVSFGVWSIGTVTPGPLSPKSPTLVFDDVPVFQTVDNAPSQIGTLTATFKLVEDDAVSAKIVFAAGGNQQTYKGTIAILSQELIPPTLKQ
jgi:hypothetical protein